ncbi:MAG: glycosyltransferase family 4 protein [Candidatus Moranbacteria bacterium]|nr:glycosyltransferase family 4 protein [Candidatus Moranbacteria bacterium]
MKILFFNYEYPPLGGGAGNATFYILKELSKITDLEIDLITSSPDEKYREEKIGDNIRIYKLPIGKNEKNLHFQSQKDLLVYAWKAYFFARKLIRRLAEENTKYDLSHSFFGVPCGFISYCLKRRFKIPYIVSLRGADVPGYSERFPAIYFILKPLIRRIWSNADFVVSNSQGLKDLAIKTNCRQEIGIIPNGIDTSQFKPHLEASLPSNDFKILCVSRITERKGIKYLIEAMKYLPEIITLEIVGEGNEKEKLEKLAENLKLKNRIKFLGLISHEKLPEIYQSAYVFVLPSLNEGMSNTILEALAAGLPIIATDTGGTKELLRDGENGFIIQMKNAKNIAEKIEKLMADDTLRKNMSLVSRKKAESLSWKNVADKYLSLYEKIYPIK